MSDQYTDLEISRLMKAPPAKVWRAFANPELLAQWWCPKPWKTEVRAFDFKPGGAFHTFMSGPLPDGTDGTSDNPGCFLEIMPYQRIVATSMLTAGWRPAASWLGMTSVFTFVEEAGGTRLVARAMHASKEDRDKHQEMGFEHGWGIMLAQWDEHSAGLED